MLLDMRLTVSVCVTFLPDGAPDGDNEDADDGENQQCQNATYDCIWHCTVSLNHCTGVCGTIRDNSCPWVECGAQKGKCGYTEVEKYAR